MVGDVFDQSRDDLVAPALIDEFPGLCKIDHLTTPQPLRAVLIRRRDSCDLAPTRADAAYPGKPLFAGYKFGIGSAQTRTMRTSDGGSDLPPSASAIFKPAFRGTRKAGLPISCDLVDSLVAHRGRG
jgi:hypothetical protein